MNRATYLIALLAVLYGVVSALFGNDGGERRPPIQPDFARQAPAPAPAGPTIEVDVGEKTSSSGTAFAIDGDGWWLTARHVADGCDAVWIQTGPRQGLRAMEVRLHPAADLALLRTRVGRTPLSLARQLPPPGDDGFSLGYPRGEPGDIHVRLMGRARLKSVGRYRINEPAVAWAEVARRPDDLPGLGGLSGGPMLDGRGRVVGVMVAASKRRGRVMTTAQSSMRELLAQIPDGFGDDAATAGDIRGGSFTERGDSLRQNLTVAKVLCRVGQPRRRPRRS